MKQRGKRKSKTKRHNPIEDESKEKKPKTNPETTFEDEPVVEDESVDKKGKKIWVLDDADKKLLESYYEVFTPGAIIDTRGFDGPFLRNYKECKVICYSRCASPPSSCDVSDTEDC